MRRLILIAILAGGCSVPSLSPYRVDVQQGNYVTQEMVNKLKPGMTRAQVRYALGAPLIVDPFHSDRWDYVYLYSKAGVVTEKRRIIVVFADDKLVRIEGDVVPQAAPPPPAPEKSAAKPAVPDAAGKPAGAIPGDTQPSSTAASEHKPASSETTGADASASDPKQDKGFFDRMLEKLGF